MSTNDTLEPGVGNPQELREVCLAHLKLIHKMSEAILAKDRQIKHLKETNRQLLQRLANVEKLQNPNPESDPVPGLNTNDVIMKRRRGRPATKDKSVGTGPTQPSINKAVQAKTDPACFNESGFVDLNDDEDAAGDFLSTSEPYFTFQGEDFIQEEKNQLAEIMSHAEVPGWRMVSFSPTYTMEGTENIEDENISRRHTKLELDERRRKRWDIQRMREQRHLEKLRARYDDSGNILNNGGAHNILALGSLSNLPHLRPDKSFLQHPDQATHILVTEELPVTAFGFQIPLMTEQDFSLPWH